MSSEPKSVRDVLQMAADWATWATREIGLERVHISVLSWAKKAEAALAKQGPPAPIPFENCPACGSREWGEFNGKRACVRCYTRFHEMQAEERAAENFRDVPKVSETAKQQPSAMECHKLDTSEAVYFYEQDFYVLISALSAVPFPK